MAREDFSKLVHSLMEQDIHDAGLEPGAIIFTEATACGVEGQGKWALPPPQSKECTVSTDAACPHVARQVQSGVFELLASQRGLRTLAYSASKGTVASL